MKVVTSTDAVAAATSPTIPRAVAPSIRPSVRLSCANTCYQGRCRRAGSQLIRNSSPLYGTFRCARWHGPACRAVPGRPAVAHDICTVHCASCVRIILAHRTRLTRTRPDPAAGRLPVYCVPVPAKVTVLPTLQIWRRSVWQILR